MASNLLNIYRKTSKTVIVDVKDSDGNPFNCFGYTPFLTVKKYSTDTTYLINETGTLSGDTNSTLVFNLTFTETDLTEGEYWYDVFIENLNEKIAVIYDKFKILQDTRYGQ